MVIKCILLKAVGANYHINFFHVFLSYYIRMIKGTVNFEDKKVNKKAFYKNKKPYDVYDIDTEKILVSKKESYGKKGSIK